MNDFTEPKSVPVPFQVIVCGVTRGHTQETLEAFFKVLYAHLPPTGCCWDCAEIGFGILRNSPTSSGAAVPFKRLTRASSARRPSALTLGLILATVVWM